MRNEFRIPHVTCEYPRSKVGGLMTRSGRRGGGGGGALPPCISASVLAACRVSSQCVRGQCNIGCICGAVISLESTIFAV